MAFELYPGPIRGRQQGLTCRITGKKLWLSGDAVSMYFPDVTQVSLYWDRETGTVGIQRAEAGEYPSITLHILQEKCRTRSISLSGFMRYFGIPMNLKTKRLSVDFDFSANMAHVSIPAACLEAEEV